MHDNIFHSYSPHCGCTHCKDKYRRAQAMYPASLDGMSHTEAIRFIRACGEGVSMLKGVGPDAPIVENENGGRQSDSPYRFDLLPPLAVAKVAEILKHGSERYAEWNWMKISANSHLNRVLQHSMAYIAGDTQEGDPVEHAARVACRALFFLEMAIRERDQLKEATRQEDFNEAVRNDLDRIIPDPRPNPPLPAYET